MKLLLDTCSFLWALHEPLRLSASARQALQDPAQAVSVSVVTFWEISLKSGLGKLSLSGVAPEDYPAFAVKSGWEIHRLSPDIAASVGRLPRTPEHRDPSDRLLVWSALREGFVLVSGDEALRAYMPHGLKLCW